MPRQRSPNRDKAKELYLKANGDIKLKDIAEQLGVSDIQIRKWKNQDKWDNELKGTLSKVKSNVTNKKVNNKSNKGTKEKPKNAIKEVPQLTEKQKLFCIYYLKNFNATQAAIKAGYSKDSAFVIGYENLNKPYVRAEIERLKYLKKQSIMINEDDIVERYMKIAFSDITDFVEFGCKEVNIINDNGAFELDDEGNIRTIKISHINFKNANEVDGGLISEIRQGKQGISIKLEDRLKALNWLAGFFEMNPEHKHRVEFDNKKFELEKERFKHQKEVDEFKNF